MPAFRSESEPALAASTVVVRPRVDSYDVVLLLVGAVSLVAMLLLVLEHFAPIDVLLLGAGVSMLVLAAFRAELQTPRLRPPDRRWWLLCAIWLLAITFRCDLYPHFIAGQDQGLYVSMSELVRRTHRLWFVDDFRQALPAELRDIYDQRVLPGVVGPQPPNDSFYVSFYPLHPAWMAISRALFGFGFHTLSLFAFSLLALAGVYRLTRLISADRSAATLALFLCSINPQLAFLSKFPLTEMMAFAFTVNAAYSACRAMQAPSRRERLLHLTIALLLVSAVFYVRISFFVVIPLLCCAYIFSYASGIAQDIARDFRRFAAGVFVCFLVSLAYYDWFAPQMSHDLLFGDPSSPVRAAMILSAVVLLTVLATLGAFYMPGIRSRELVARLEQRSMRYVCYLPLLVIVAALIPAYQAIETGRLAWTFNAPPGLANIKYSLLYRLLLIASPFLAAAVLLPHLQRAVASTPVLYLTVFLAGAWMVTLLWIPTLPYLYYHGRYISAEVLPSLVMLASIVLAAGLRSSPIRRRWAMLLIAGATAYSLLWTGAQVGELESDRPGFVADMDHAIGPRDVLVVFADDIGVDVVTPLRLYLGKNVFYFGEEIAKRPRDVEKAMALLLDRRGLGYDRILLLASPSQRRYKLELERRTTLRYESSFFTNGERAYQAGWRIYPRWPSFLLPAKNVTIRRDFALYEVKAVPQAPPSLALGCRVDFTANGAGRDFLDAGWSDQEPDYIWSDGPAATITGIVRSPRVDTPLLLRLRAHAYVGPGEMQRVLMRLNGVDLGAAELSSQQTVTFAVPANTLGKNGEWTLRLQFPDAHSPQSRGAGADPRLLGIGIRALQFDDAHGGTGEPCSSTAGYVR